MKILRDFRCWLFFQWVTQPVPGIKKWGKECSWHIVSDYLGEKSRVISAGAGHDISFEEQLNRHFRCEIVLLDPSPTGLETWQRKSYNNPEICFKEEALGYQDGILQLAPPLNSEEGSFRSAAGNTESGITVPSRSLMSLMSEKRWESLDLLKMDVEGAEFGVIRSIIEQGIQIKQICVEFHHGKGFNTTRKDTLHAILSLRRAGYRLVHRVHWDHTFVHQSML